MLHSGSLRCFRFTPLVSGVKLAFWIVCARAEVEKAAAEKTEPGNLIVNGSFEKRRDDEPPCEIATLKPGSQDPYGWKIVDAQPKPVSPEIVGPSSPVPDELVEPKTVDWIGPARWKASNGDHCLDLDGGVRQTVSTKPGEFYYLAFDLAGNPEAGPLTKILRLDTD